MGVTGKEFNIFIFFMYVWDFNLSLVNCIN